MARLFLDTSALVKLYVAEFGTPELVELARPSAGHRLAVLALSRVEFRAAVRRRTNIGDLDQATASVLLNQLEQQWSVQFLIQPLSDTVLEAAMIVIDRYALRTLDAIQLAGCLTMRANVEQGEEVWFVTADDDLLEPARQEGFRVVNPGHG